MPITLNTPKPLSEHVTFPWWVMLVALPFIIFAVVLAPVHFPGASGSTIALAAAGLAAFLGLHAPVPEALKRRPAIAKAIALASGGGVAKLILFLPMVTDARIQGGIWAAVAFLSWLAGMPLTVGVSGQALPAVLTDPGQGI
jgi:hypothetical protein